MTPRIGKHVPSERRKQAEFQQKINEAWRGFHRLWGYGKHKGRRLIDMPSSYFNWVLDSWDDLDPRLERVIKDLLQYREEQNR